MTALHAALLGLIQGLTEFLPVSSSGHLILAEKFFGVTEGSMQFAAILHLGTLIPVFVAFRKEILALLKKPIQKTTGLLVIGTLPAVAAALLLGDAVDRLFSYGFMLGLGFFVTGALLLYADRAARKEKKKDELGYVDACVVGLLQAVAIAPGISRSGSVLTGALARGVKRENAASFSFLLSIPAIAGGAVFALKDVIRGGAPLTEPPAIIAVGFITAAVSGYFAIRLTLGAIKKLKLKYFAYYVFVLGAIVIAFR